MGWRGPEPPFYPSCSHTALERCALSEVLPQQLYLTNFKGAGDPTSLVERGVTHVAAVGAEFVEDTSDKLTYWHKDITDDDSEGATMAASLKDGVDFLHAAIGGGGCVVVHCAAGISRSASLVIGYFIVHRRQSLRDAFAAVFKARPCIWPNEGFMDALIALEQEQTGATTITSAEYERWGDYDGPEEDTRKQLVPPGFPPRPGFPPGMPRLKREETCLEEEIRQLAILEALAKGERVFAVRVQRIVRSYLERLRQKSNRYSLASCGSDDDEAFGSPEPSPPLSGTKRMSLSKADRKSAAMDASMEARRASMMRNSGLGEGGGAAGGGKTLLEEAQEWREKQEAARALQVTVMRRTP